MNRIRRGSITLFSVILASIAGLIFVCSPAAGEECTATVTTTPDLRVHVPALFLGAHTYSVDLQYLPTSDGSIWFDIVGLGVADGVQCENPAHFDLIAGTYEFYVPTVAIGSDQYWAAFHYVPETAAALPKAPADANGAKVVLDGLDRKGNSIPGTDRFPDKFKFSSNLHLSTGGDEFSLEVDMLVQAEVSLGVPALAGLGTSEITYGSSSGALKLAAASCNFASDIPCFCGVNVNGEGTFSATDLKLSHLDTPNPIVVLRYDMGFPSSTIKMWGYCCDSHGCDEPSETDYTGVFRGYYEFLRVPDIEKEAANFLAKDWQFHPNPRSGLYATKSYPPKTISVGVGEIQATGNTEMSLLETSTR